MSTAEPASLAVACAAFVRGCIFSLVAVAAWLVIFGKSEPAPAPTPVAPAPNPGPACTCRPALPYLPPNGELAD